MSPLRRCPSCGIEFLGAGDRCAQCLLPAGAADPARPLQAGEGFHGMEVLGELGRGGMAIVYKARQTKLDRVVALKILPPERFGDAEFQLRFEREAKALAALSHPNIVPLFDYGAEEELCFMVMEFVAGGNLRTYLSERRPRLEEAMRIIAQVCDALDYAHGRGIIHRDIKPENLLLTSDGEVKVADFGLARLAHSGAETRKLTQSGVTLGTADYAPPEQFEAPERVDARADIYSTGVVLYEILTGKVPRGSFAPASTVSPSDPRLDPIIRKALDPLPEARHATIRAFKDDLFQVAPDRPVPWTSRARKRLSVPWRAVAVLIFVLAGVGAVLLWRGGRASPERAPSRPSRPEGTFERVCLNPEEGPAGERPRRPDVHFSKTPKLINEPGGIDLLLRYLYAREIRGIIPRDVARGYVIRWPSVDVVVIQGPYPDTLRTRAARTSSKLWWVTTKADTVVIVLAQKESNRPAFVGVVKTIQRKLGRPATGP